MGHDIIDTRDLLVELRDMVGGDELHPDPELLAALDVDERERMERINELLDDTGRANTVDGRNSWGVTMIPEHEFVDYARQLAEEIGAMPEGDHWPASYIDWDAAADALKTDYSTVEFEGVTYYWREP